MKASTKAEKLRRKRGRPRLAATGRELNGQPSRRKASADMRQAIKDGETEAEARRVAVDRRIRHDNIVPFRDKSGRIVTAEEQAIDPRRGYVLGLMLMDGTITRPQHDAGLRYAEDMARFYGLCAVPFPSARAQNLFAVRGSDGEETQGRATAASAARFKANKLRDVLLAVGNIDDGRRIVHAVLEVAVLDNLQARKWPEHMRAFVRRGLNRLVVHYELFGVGNGG